MIFSSSPFEWLLENLELDASLFHAGHYCGQWQASTQGMQRASFHLLVNGHCWLHHSSLASSIELNSGDAIFLLRDLPYRLSSESCALAASSAPRKSMLEFNQAADTHSSDGSGLVCGFFQFRPGLSSLLLEALPDVLVLRAEQPGMQAARPIFDLILQECARANGPSASLLERLSSLLFLYTLREQNGPELPLKGLLTLARQPQFAQLLGELIAHPAKAWSLTDMAAICGLSRSAFAKRFQELSNTSPGHVLLNLRMREACRLLQQGQAVAEVSELVGYQSIAAFTRAFSKVVGVLPGAYKRQHQ